MRVAMRSFTDPPGLRYSIFARTIGPVGAPARSSRERDNLRSGVLPMRSRSESTYCIPTM
jgi:hypothetical protein